MTRDDLSHRKTSEIARGKTVMFSAHFEDSHYKAMDAALKRQSIGELPGGSIRMVKRVGQATSEYIDPVGFCGLEGSAKLPVGGATGRRGSPQASGVSRWSFSIRCPVGGDLAFGCSSELTMCQDANLPFLPVAGSPLVLNAPVWMDCNHTPDGVAIRQVALAGFDALGWNGHASVALAVLLLELGHERQDA